MFCSFCKGEKMNNCQRNSRQNRVISHDKFEREKCWFCRPCYSNFPPEINWDCQDDNKDNKKNFYSEDIEDRYAEYDLEYEYDFDNKYENHNRKENQDKKISKSNNSQNRRPCCRCQRRCDCCGFFRIFRY